MLKESMEYLSRRIKNRMVELNIGQEEMGKRAGVSQSTINRILNTPTKSRIDTIFKVARALSLPPEYLIIPDEKKAVMCRAVNDMSPQEIQDTLFHIEKEKLWKKTKKAV